MPGIKYTLLNGALVHTRAGTPDDRKSEPAGVAHLIALRPSIADLEEFLAQRIREAQERLTYITGDHARDLKAIEDLDERLVIERVIEILRETRMTIPDLTQ